ncbi:YcaO-like family protein [Streptomyces sp. NPDC006487]|uniref:YcaO-like family protein n=1 Tax=Streptomyces sp. NPDC006487 TaxID=3364748 RepID=UPI0036BA8D8B
MSLLESAHREAWDYQRFRSPFHGLYGSVVIADDDVLGVAWDVDPRSAGVRALGEAVERSALYETPLEQVRGRAAGLGPAAIRLDDRVTFSPRQLAESPRLAVFGWDEDTETTWTPMRSPRGERLVPYDVARRRIGDADSLRPKPMTSIGTACADDAETALGRALLEVVERHAVASAVYAGTPASLVDAARYGAGDIVSLLGTDARLRVGLIDSGVPGIRVAIAAISGVRGDLPQAGFGSGAGLCVEDAVRAAALEAVHVFHLGWRLMRRGTPADPVPTSVNQRTVWWARHGLPHIDDYFTAEEIEVSGGADARHGSPVARVGGFLDDHGYDWGYADITPPWASGVVVARAVVPSFLHLQINEFPFLVAPRFQTVVNAFMERTSAGTVVPHPFV